MKKLTAIFFFILAPHVFANLDCNEHSRPDQLDKLSELAGKAQYLIERDIRIEKNKENLNKLMNEKATSGVEIIVAGATKDQGIASRWGHAMIRFLDDDDDWRNDYVVSFVLDQNEEELSYGKAIFGGYPIYPETKTLGEFWGQYVKGEARPLHRTLIPTDDKLRENILARLKDKTDAPEKLGTYKFTSRNCASVLGDLLSEAGIQQKKKTNIPTKLQDSLSQSLVAPFPALTVKAPKQQLLEAAKELKISYEELMSGEKYPDNASEKLLKKYSPEELATIYHHVDFLPADVSDKIGSVIKEKNTTDLDSLYGFNKVPKSLYQICNDETCAREQVANAKKIWGENRVKKHFDELQSAYNKKRELNLTHEKNIEMLLNAEKQFP